MARRNDRVRVGSSDVAVNTGVHAPSYVAADDSAARNADAISRALGLGAAAYDEQTQRIQQRDFDAGSLAAQSGEVTEETIRAQEQSAAWVFGAEREIARSRAIEDEAALVQWYETEADKTLPLPEMRAAISERMRGLYEGADPGIAREAAPFLKRAADRVMAAHGQRQAEEAKAQVATALSINLGEFLSRPADQRTQEEWDGRRGIYMSLLGRTEGLQAMAADLATAAINQRNEAILDDPMFAMLRSNPAVKDMLDQAHENALNIRRQDRTAAETMDRAVLFTALTLKAEGGDFSVVDDLEVATTPDADGLLAINQSQAQSILAQLYDRSEGEALVPVYAQYWSDGNFGTHGDHKYEDEAAQAAIQAVAATQGPEAARAFAVERSVANGGIPPFMLQLMERANIENATSWPEAYALFQEFDAQQPAFLETQLTEDTMRSFKTYQILAEDFGHEGAVARMDDESYDKSLVEEVTRDERTEAISSIIGEVTDLPWSWRTVEETPALRRRIDREFDHMIALGYSHERAAEFAVERISRSTVAVDGSLFHANAGWGADPEAVAAQLKLDYATEHGYDADDIEIMPIARNPAAVYVSERNGTARVEYSINGARERHEQVVRDAMLARTTERETSNRTAYTESVKRRLFPGVTQAARRAREEGWNRMSPTAQRAALEDFARQQRLDDEAAIRRVQEARRTEGLPPTR